MALDDLYKSLSMFQDGMQKLAINQGIQGATSQVEQLNSQMMSEMEKRQAQTQIAKNLSLQLTQAGANGQQIQTAMGAIAPPTIANSADAYNQAVATNDPGLMKMAKDMQGFEEKPKLDQLNATGQNAKDVANINGAWHMKAAQMAANQKLELRNQKKPIPTPLMEKITALDDQLTELSALRGSMASMKDNMGPWSGSDVTGAKAFLNPAFGNFKAQVGRQFDEYRKRITGAGAGEKEIKMLEANQLSIRDTPELFEQKLSTLEKLATTVRNRRLKQYGSLYDVGDLAEMPVGAEGTEVNTGLTPPVPQGIPQGSQPITVMQEGKAVQAYRLPNGKIAIPE